MAVVTLPKFVVLQSKPTGKYLRYLKEDGDVHGYVQFSGDNVASPEAKFEVENAKCGNGLVHLRSCYSNKYLTVNDKSWIVATAKQKEEDQSKRSCTLLKPSSVDGDVTRIRLTHVFLGHNLCLWRSYEPNKYACLVAYYSDLDKESFDVFNVIDWESLVILPKYVVFKGDNGYFLGGGWQEHHPYLMFYYADATTHPTRVGHEIIPNSDGTIRIKSLFFDKFWRRSPNWIWADSSDTSTDNKDTLFMPVKYDDKTIGLKNLGNNNFCARLNADGKEHCLNANSYEINQWARLEVSEYVVSRKIENIRFRVMDSRIYDETPLVVVSDVIINNGTTSTEHTVDLTHTNTTSSTWNASISLKLGMKATYDVGLPLIFEGKIEFSAEVTASYAQGETKTTTDTITKKHKVDVPPKTKKTVRMVATQGKCDVPYSYTLRDVLNDGTTVITHMDDGVYTGVNSYNGRIEVKEEPLNGSNNASAEFKMIAKV